MPSHLQPPSHSADSQPNIVHLLDQLPPRLPVKRVLAREIWWSIKEDNHNQAEGFEGEHVPVYCPPSKGSAGHDRIRDEGTEEGDAAAKELEATCWRVRAGVSVIEYKLLPVDRRVVLPIARTRCLIGTISYKNENFDRILSGQ